LLTITNFGLLVITIFIYNSCSISESDKESLCFIKTDVKTAISFDIPKNELKTIGNPNEIFVFKKELDSIYSLQDVKFISEEIYLLNSNYSMYYSIIETEDCGNVFLIGVKKNLDDKILFYNFQYLFHRMVWAEQNESIYIYIEAFFKSTTREIINTYQIIFDFNSDGVYVSIDDGFSNWKN